MTTITPDNLNAVMEFHHVIRVNEDLTIDEHVDLFAPDLEQNEVEEGKWEESMYDTEWSLLSGFSGQDRYTGPMMHESEYIGGGLAAHILATPGYWVAIYPTVTDIDGEELVEDSWAVAFKAL